MNIKNVGTPNPYTDRRVQESGKPQGAERASGQRSGPSSDTVSLSGEARLRGAALNEAAQSPDVRREKVNELKEKVRNGTYKPDLRKAAANLIREDLQLTPKD